MKISSLAFAMTLASTSMAQSQFDGCDVNEYYAGLGDDSSLWTKEAFHQLSRANHRQVLNFTNTEEPGVNDVWAALIDLDMGQSPDTVKLLYNNQDIASIPFGQRTWVKEHLFPVLRGVGILGPDVSDIHNIRPSTVLPDIVRNYKYFGECGVLVRTETCTQPAEGAADDTCSCNRVFTPPASVKGDIARALLYMDMRYEGDEPLTLDLRLTDCPFQPERDMAYLSQMLTWHMEDPPDAEEIARNNKACANWQGNRNPFIDFPQLAQQLYGDPLPLPAIGERLIYEACEAIPTLAPTFTPNQCEFMEPGDIQFWLLNSQGADSFGLFTFVDLPEGFTVYVTDNPWDGEDFIDNGEGTLVFTAPTDGGVPAGNAFGYGSDDMNYTEYWTMDGDFSLMETGEPVFVYCKTSAGDNRPILAFNYGGSYVDASDAESYAENESALPESMGDFGQVDLQQARNHLYVGEGDLPDDQLKAAVVNPDNWDSSNDSRFAVSDRTSGATSSLSISMLLGTAMAVIASWSMLA